jgi:hypothetical protein
MLKSNITISSNVFNRVAGRFTDDPKYVATVNETNALQRIKPMIGGISSSVRLSAWQDDVIKNDRSCFYNRKANRVDSTHGLIQTEDGFAWSCRCEHTTCTEYENCMASPHSRRITRIIKIADDISDEDNAPTLTFYYEHLGDITDIFKPPNFLETDDIYYEDIEDDENSDSFESAQENSIVGEYIKIDNPDIIITADIDSHILVNAGPGTGKTYTIIKRLEHIAKTQAVDDFRSVLVLCYTNAAKNEIRKRLETGISTGVLPPEARQFDIRTFDSLATAYLANIEDAVLSSLDYNKRIARFNQRFNAETFSLFEYVIIDELQDLVNERSNMTLNILGSLTGGWLLCGDKCQAIYDYDCIGDDKINSSEFYKKLEDIFPVDTLKYELIVNRRQSDDLTVRSNALRKALLEFPAKKTNEFFQHEYNRHQFIRFSTDLFTNCDPNATTAILCRSNGEAEWVSTQFHNACIPHNLLRSVVQRPSLNRWLADIFWDYRENQCGKNDFVERYCARIADNESQANFAFNAIISAVESMLDKGINRQTLDMDNVRKALRIGFELDSCLLNTPVEHLTVSTIHKAKGREFDNVYLLNSFDPKHENTDEARVWYVGVTRPKRSFYVHSGLGKYFSKPTPMGRRVSTAFRYNYRFCTHIIVGFPNDIDDFSFINGDFQQALTNQNYIAKSVKTGDKVELTLHNRLYEIFHNGRHIGTLSPEIIQDFWTAIEMTDNRANIPPFISDVFVSNIVTITPYHQPSSMERMFRESKFWLGVEITGFGKVDWKYGR